ncbi:MAG: ATP-dependent zinc metalloprotease FtsH [Chlamydiales bacterium]|nr:ATP-dependent zinc metalloprotease FtsH [Chlamydiales bacterium]
MAAVLLVLMVQNFLDTKPAQVSFSYQLEHLVNLELIQPEESRKIALNDNLVTFSGKFRQRITEEGKARYKYLELLNNNHELRLSMQDLQADLAQLRERITSAGDWFLYLSGIPIPAKGYVIVDDLYNTLDHNYSVVISELPPKNIDSYKDLEKELAGLRTNPTANELSAFSKSLAVLLRNFRSPILGIGNVPMKQQLDQLDQQLTQAENSESGTNERLGVYTNVMSALGGVIADLNVEEDHLRLTKLRSVRAYRDQLDKFETLSSHLEENQLQLDKTRENVAEVIWFFNNQELSTKQLEKQDPEVFHQWFLHAQEEWENFPENRGGVFRAPDQPLNLVLEKTFKSQEPAINYGSYLFTLMPVLLVLLVLYFLFSRQMKGVGNSAMNFGKSPARMMAKGSTKVTFKDVAGVDEAIEELQEIVEFLKAPHKFTSLGGRIPKGVLCIGPPGTGKTLIAKAVAGEADRPFFSISGSDFVEMFVGVGASRIRDLFDQAKKNAPCIIFMDEIDAVGRHRGAGIGGGHDEREQTLNQLLVEMDGFDTNDGVILMAATNRPDVLDKALLRPGRFDRRVVINLPDIKGRFDILKVHARRIKLDTSVDLLAVARATPGASGADLANLLNEAALLAARRGRTAVTGQEVSEARDKVLYGKERRSLELDDNEKKTTAYHESGHTIVGLVVEHGDPVDKVTIIPRGMSLGATMFLPIKNRVSYWKKELVDQLAVLMGGRAAEEVFIEDVSSGARQDIEQATSVARSMVCEWGMSDILGTVAYDERADSGQYLGMTGYHEKKYSEATAQRIDEEVRRLVDEGHARAVAIVKEHADQVKVMAEMLIEFETLDADDVKLILAGTWNTEEKRARLLLADERFKKPKATPPPPPPQQEAGSDEKHPPPITQGSLA